MLVGGKSDCHVNTPSGHIKKVLEYMVLARHQTKKKLWFSKKLMYLCNRKRTIKSEKPLKPEAAVDTERSIVP